MANTLITPQIIAKEALFHLQNNLVFGSKVHREYKREFVKIGDSVTIRRPVRFRTTSGATRVNQDVIEPTTSLTIQHREHVSWNFSSQDLTLTVAEYGQRYIKPAMIALADKIDRDIAIEGAKNFYNLVGTSVNTGSGFGPINSFQPLSNVAKRLDNLSVPDDGMRCLTLNPDARWDLANGLGGTGSGGLFNADIVDDTVRRGRLGRLATLDIYGDQNIARHTVGAYSGTPLVNGAVTNAANTVSFDGMTGAQQGALRAGDIISFAGVNGVNPVNGQDTGELAQFVVVSDVTTAGGAGTVTIYPALNDGSTTSTAAYKNVTALPADNAAITVQGRSGQQHSRNLAFHRNALALVTVDLELPDSATFKARANFNGYSLRVVKDYDIDEDEEIIRIDALYGTKAIYPDLGVILAGQ